MRHAAKRDANEPAIIAAFKAHLAHAEPVSDKGIPDLLVTYRGRTHTVEVKSADGKLTKAQFDYVAKVTPYGGVVHVVRSVEDVSELIRRWSDGNA